MDFPLPELGEGVYEAEMIKWLVKVGDQVKRGQNLLEVMTDKATMDVPSPFAGTIDQLNVEPGSRIKVGQLILSYVPAGSKAETQTPVTPKTTAQATANETVVTTKPIATVADREGNGRAIAASPSVRHLARKLGMDLSRIRGTGPGGRILLDDVTAQITKPECSEKSSKPQPPKEDYGTAGTTIKLIGLRRKIAEHLVDSKRRIPHYSYIDECDVTELVRLRQSLRDACSRQGIKLTYLPFFAKAVVAALKEIPIVNSSLNEEKGEITLHNHYNIGIAVATPNGLVVPVVHDADQKDIFTLANEIDRLGNDTKNGRAKLEDLRGGSFTITSVGNIGGLISTPIVNHPEVGIMGVGKIIKRPVYDDRGEIKPADLVYLSFSFDHRVLDGAIGAAFGNAVKRHLENPAAMLVPDRR